MTDMHEDAQPATYPWRAAPSHLKTRRQLRAAGLRPNGQDPAALMVRESGGRRRKRLWAYLFDVEKAAPKRTASPAQMEAVARAVRGRQLRAAERRGLDLDDLTQEADPGPAWIGTHKKEEITMSDTFTDPDRDRSQAALDADILEDQRRFYESSLDNVDVDHAEDFAIHMQDPTATAEQFVDTRADRAQRLEQSLDRVQAELDQHLRTHRETLAADPVWGPQIAEQEAAEQGAQTQSGGAGGPGQRVARLHALIAVNRARHELGKITEARQVIREAGEAPEHSAGGAWAVSYLDAHRRRIAQWEGQPPWHLSREALPQALADALVWSHEDEAAQYMVTEIVEHYRTEWGVVVDAGTLTVTIDDQFDPSPIEQFNEAAAVWHREAAVLDIVSAASMTAEAKDAAMQALNEWTSSWATEGGSHTYIDTADQRREQLRRDLSAAKMPDADREQIEFLVDYLRGDLAGVDLLKTPTLVDPGEEVRGRIPQLLAGFADKTLTPAAMAEEISVMSPADQEAVRNVGRAIVAGENPSLVVWPGYVDRDQLLEQLQDYAHHAEYQLHEADGIAEQGVTRENPGLLGVSDFTGQRLKTMVDLRRQLDTAATNPSPNGLSTAERAQLSATLNDIDTGRIRSMLDLPDLMWADDRSRATVDGDRQYVAAEHLAKETRRHVREIIHGPDRTPQEQRLPIPLGAAIDGVRDALSNVATGPGPEGIDKQRHEYHEKVQGLGEELARAGIGQTDKRRIREVIDHSARTAGQLGRNAVDREQQWKTRTERVVGARNDALAQRQAAAAGRAPRQSRSGAHRSERAAQPSTPAPARVPAGRRQLHSDLGR
ncbi:RRQRL motif-containing zinc-binding protein [Nocardia rhamnosiphila]|uniref:RRQRL motif-containing zinc-binding protein n=1 Tax=Nocardia rhamnosiphila TaxID=426716 RepID=A0ABV2X0W0_9NOCA